MPTINVMELVAGMQSNNSLATAKAKAVEISADMFRRVVAFFTTDATPKQFHREYFELAPDAKLSKKQRRESRKILSSVALTFTNTNAPENFPAVYFGKFSRNGGYKTISVANKAEWEKAQRETVANLPSNISEEDEN